MARNIEIDIDMFARGIDELIGDIPKASLDNVGRAVRQSARKTAKGLRDGEFGSAGRHPWSEEYMKGFKSHSQKGAMNVEAEVGNSAKPGLVHLLEKGHLTLTGRRTNAYPHMAPAFDAMQEDFMDRASRAIGQALEG